MCPICALVYTYTHTLDPVTSPKKYSSLNSSNFLQKRGCSSIPDESTTYQVYTSGCDAIYNTDTVGWTCTFLSSLHERRVARCWYAGELCPGYTTFPVFFFVGPQDNFRWHLRYTPYEWRRTVPTESWYSMLLALGRTAETNSVGWWLDVDGWRNSVSAIY